MNNKSDSNRKVGAVVQKPQNMKQTVFKLLKYMKKNTALIVLTLLITFCGTVLQVLAPKVVGNAITEIFNGIQLGGINFHSLTKILMFAAMLYAGTFIGDFLQQRFMVVVSQKTTYDLRNDVKSKMNRVPVSFFDKNSNGNLMSIAANDVDNIATNLQQSLVSLISSMVIAIGTIAMMFYISPLLAVIALLMIPETLLIMKFVSPIAQKNNKAYFKSLGNLNGQIEETYQGFQVVKGFNGEAEALGKFGNVNEQMYESGWKARFFGGITMPLLMLVQNLVYVIIAAVGCVKVVTGNITIGDMQAFLQYSSIFSKPLMQLSQIWSNILSMLASAERVFELLEAEETIEYEQIFENKVDNDAKVSFENVGFGYGDTTLMNNFCLDVAKGEMVAIVGHTGAGKTTLINLVERFYEIQKGSISIDGVDIRNMTQKELRKKMAMVLQDTWLFSGTIYENIKYGNENVTDEQIFKTAKAAFVDDFARKLPDGYNTLLNEEASNISQGQRQLITIARALVADPEILILDEATSNVDSRTEMVIQKAMKKLLSGRTSFIVAHRLSTIYDADKILVMDKGDIVESGNHSCLISKNGVYADIYNSQFEQNGA